MEVNGLPMDQAGGQSSSRAPTRPPDWILLPDFPTKVDPTYWPFRFPVEDANGTPIPLGTYVQVSGSLVTDPAHIGQGSQSYNDAMTIWQGNESHTSPTNPARWTEIHPPDSIQRVSDIDPNATPGTTLMMGVAVCCQSGLLDTGEVYNEITTDLRPNGNQPAGEVAQVTEYVGHETAFSSIVEGNATLTGAQITKFPDKVTVHVKVRGQPFHGGPGKFKAVYRLWWAPPSATQVTVPSVVGQTVSDAAAAIEAAGLTWSVTSTEYGGERPTVIGQNPAGGSLADRGSRVGIGVLQPKGPPK